MNTHSKLLISGSGGSSSSDSHTPTEAPDTLQSRSYVRILDLLCEGEIEGLVGGEQGVYLDGTPLVSSDGTKNFSGYTLAARNGQQSQSHISGFPDVENEVNVSTEVTRVAPVVRTITNPDIDALRMKFRVPSLNEQLSNGDIVGASVQVLVSIKSAEQTAYGAPKTVNISGKTTSPYERQLILGLTGSAPWTIQVERVTPDSDLVSLNNDISWAGYTEIIYAKLAYPNTALCGISIDAEQFPSVPTRTYDLKMAIVKVPTNYEQLSHNHIGFWDGSFKMEWTDNPAWCYYDMVTNPRYGLGDLLPEALIDKWQLYQIAKYCDELVPDGYGGEERRFTMNAYFDTSEQALKMLNDMTSVFRSMLYWSGESLVAVQDAPQDIAYLFTESNVLDGKFSYESSSRKTRPTAVTTQWINPELGYEPDYEYVEDAEGIQTLGLMQEDIVAIGCTSRGQAHRFGKWYLYTSKLETQVVSFGSGLEGVALRPGMIVGIQDRSRSGAKWGGRIRSFVGTTVTLDREVILDPAKTNFLNVTTVEGTPVTVRILPSHGTTGVSVIDVESLPDFTPDIAEYAIFTISNPSKEMEQARIITIEESDGTYNIAALIQHPGKFDLIEQDIKLEDRGTTRGSKPVEPQGLAISDYLYIDTKIVKTMMSFDWVAQEDALNYDLQYRKQDGNWVTVTELAESNFQVEDVLPGEFEVWVRVRNVLKLTSKWSKVTGSVYGKLRPPEDITGFGITLSSLGIELSWTDVTDLDLSGYEIRVGNSWDDSDLVDFTKSTNTTHLPNSARYGRTLYYHIRAKDTSSNYSENVISAEVNIPKLTNVGGFRTIQHDHQLTFYWDKPETDLISHWEIRSGEVWASGVPLLTTKTVGAKQEWLFVGDRYFWIKAFDIFGFESEKAVFYNMDVTPKVHVNVVDSIDFHLIGFPGTHPGMDVINGVELRMNPAVLSGEYNYEVELAKEYHCTLLVDANIRALSTTGANWKASAFPWASEEAEFPWAPKEDLKTLSYSHRVAIEDGSGIGTLLDALPLDVDLNSWNGVAPTVAVGVSHAPCRFHDGVRISPVAKLEWGITLPSEFATTFHVKLEGLGSGIGVGHYLAGLRQSGSDELTLTYDAQKGVVSLTGQSNETIRIPFHVAAGQVFAVGIMQSTYFRTLVVRKLAGDVYSKSVLAAPSGGFDTLRLTAPSDPLAPAVVAAVAPAVVAALVADGSLELSVPEAEALANAV